MIKENTLIGVFETHYDVENAVKELQKSGFDMTKLSIIGKDYYTEEDVVGFYNIGRRVEVWGKRGAFWGWIFGAIFGSAFFFVPGIGAVVIGGPFISWLLGVLESTVVVGGISALGAVLFSIGVPKDSIIEYETSLKTDKFLLICRGTPEDISSAKTIYESIGAKQITSTTK